MSNPNRAVLWNVQEPDDPYDIKRSMIAKLPNHPPKPMGPYLELVCLLQAAQIERLADFLTEIRAKYRELQRRELDRHSYEIQIKELAERTLAYNAIKSENDRLKDFIRRQTQELQQAQKGNANSMSLQALQAKYEGLLNQLRVAREQRERSQVSISRLTFEVGEWRGKWQRSQVQRTSLRGQLQVEMRERVAVQVRAVRQKSQDRQQKLSRQVSQLREWLQGKNQEIQILSGQRDQLARQVKLLQEKNRNRGSIEESLTEKNRELQRVTLLLNDKSSKLDQTAQSLQQIRIEIKSYEERFVLIEREKETLILRLREAEMNSKKNDAFERYEDKIAMMSMEIERLNGLNSGRARETAQAGAQLQRLKIELQRERQGRDESQRLKVSHEGRISLLNQELERVNGQLNAKNEQFYALMQRVRTAEGSSGQLKGLSSENARLKQELQAARTEARNYRSITESELSTLRTEITRLKLEFDQAQGNRGQAQRLRLQCDRLRSQLQRARSEVAGLRRSLQEERSNYSRFGVQRSGLVEQNRRLSEQNRRVSDQNRSLLQGLRRQGDQKRLLTSDLLQLRTQIVQVHSSLKMGEERQRAMLEMQQQLQVLRGRKLQLQESIQKIYGEIDRLHGLLSAKTSQLLRVSKESAQWQQRVRFMEAKMSNMASQKQFNEGEIDKIRGELQSLSKLGSEAQRELQRRSSQFGSERQRWQLQRVRLQRLLGQNQKLIGQHVKERENLQRKLIELQRELAQRVPQEDQLKREQERVREQLRSKEVLILQLQTVVRQRQSQFRESESQTRQWQGRVTEWQTRAKQSEKLLIIREQQKEKLIQDVRKANTELARVKQQLTRSNLQIGRLRDQLSRLQQQNGRVRSQEQQRWKEEVQRMKDESQRWKEQGQRWKERGDNVNQQNLRLRMRVDQLASLQKSRNGEQHLRVQLHRAQQTIRLQRSEGDNLRSQIRRLQDLITRQTRELQTVKESVKEYQLKIVHIESTNSKHLQERVKQQESRLLGEIQEKDRLIMAREGEIRQLQSQIGALQAQLSALVQRDRSSLNNLNHYQDKMGLLSVEIERLNSTIRQKAAEYKQKDRLIEALRVQAGAGRREDVEKYRIEVANLKTALQQLENINMHTIEERDQLFKICHQLQAKIEEGQRQGDEGQRLRDEGQRLRDEGQKLRDEVNQLRHKQQSLLIRIRDLEQKMVSYSQQIQGLRVENANLGTTVRELQTMVEEARVSAQESLRGQLGQYALIAQGKEEEVGLWQNKYTGLYSAYEQLYHNYNITKNQYQVTIANVRLYETKLFKLQEDFSTLSESYKHVRSEVETLRLENSELKAKSQEGGQLYEKNLLLSKEIDRLTEINRHFKLEIEELRLRLTDSVSLSKRIEEHLALFVVLFAEIEALRSRLLNSENECEQVRRNSLVPLRVDQNQNRL